MENKDLKENVLRNYYKIFVYALPLNENNVKEYSKGLAIEKKVIIDCLEKEYETLAEAEKAFDEIQNKYEYDEKEKSGVAIEYALMLNTDYELVDKNGNNQARGIHRKIVKVK